MSGLAEDWTSCLAVRIHGRDLWRGVACGRSIWEKRGTVTITILSDVSAVVVGVGTLRSLPLLSAADVMAGFTTASARPRVR